MNGDLDSWSDFLKTLVDVTGADGANLASHNIKTGMAEAIGVPYSPSEMERYWRHYSTVNPWTLGDNVLEPDGAIIPSEAIVPVERLRRTEFYNDWSRKNEIVYSIGIHLGIENNRFRYLALNRGDRSGPHSSEVLKYLALLVPHIQNAIRLHAKLQELGDLNLTLDHLTIPVFLIDEDCHVSAMTRAAKRMLANALSPLKLGARNRIVGRTRNGTMLADELSSLIHSPLVPFRLFRFSSETPQFRSVGLLVRNESRGVFSARSFLIAIFTPEFDDSTGVRALAALYRLTSAETRLVQGLVSTGSLDLTLESLGVSRNTGRTQMASVFAKTGTSRQGQVIRLFSQIANFTQMGDEN